MADKQKTPKFDIRKIFNLKKSADIFIGIAAIGVVLMLIVPLPTWLLDILLIGNLGLALMIILSTMYVKKPSDFSSFPTLILLTTVFGLALNVSSTRLILTQRYAGKIIQAFGDFVVRGNYVVGFIIFIILLAIQFLVITKGATRVSEVAARFTLDAMPGKQLAINEDLNNGLITEDEARAKREELRLETDFYGNMDGSSKFVSGNVKVALVITIVNVIGGLIIGVAMRGEGMEGAKAYILLTIGDGLISQIPALLVSTATGIIVTRTVSDKGFGASVISQIGIAPQVLFIAGGVIAILGFLPGFPTILNLLIGGVLIGIGFMMLRSIKRKTEEKELGVEEQKIQDKPTTIEDIMRVDPMNLEIGYNLIPLVDEEQGGDLLKRIKLIRKRIGLDLGILVPPIRIIDNVAIDATEYLVKIRGTEVSRAKVHIGRLLAMKPNADLSLLEGIEVQEPAFGIKAKWIKEEARSNAEGLGFEIFDSAAVIATHLTEIIKKNAPELLTRQDVQSIMDALRGEYPAIVNEVLENSGGIGEIQKVLQNLLKEGVSIRNMLSILETIADYSRSVKNIDLLTEHVRQSLSKQIVSQYVDGKNALSGIVIDPEFEEILADSIHETSDGLVSTLDTDTLHLFVNTAGDVIENALKAGFQPVIMSSQKVRRLVREVLERYYPSIPVLSYSEVPANFSLNQIGIVELQDENIVVE